MRLPCARGTPVPRRARAGLRVLVLLALAIGSMACSRPATAQTFEVNQTVGGYNYHATATFSYDSGSGQWTMVVTNLGDAVSQNGQVLTGIFWDGATGSYSRVSANPSAGSGLFNDDGTAWGGESLAQHSAYSANPLSGYTEGIGIAGFGIFGDADAFASAGGDPVLNGVDYGLVSSFAAGGLGGNQDPFTRNSATFVLGNATTGDILHVRFQFGSQTSDQSFVATPSPAPEPSSALLVLAGLPALAFLRARKRRPDPV